MARSWTRRLGESCSSLLRCTGGAERARAYAKRLDAGLALCDKRREKANVAEVMNVVGDVNGKNCLIIDDMCDTGGTICKVAEALKKAGADEIYACFSHAVLARRASLSIFKAFAYIQRSRHPLVGIYLDTGFSPQRETSSIRRSMTTSTCVASLLFEMHTRSKFSIRSTPAE